jgi:hypothetical protein
MAAVNERSATDSARRKNFRPHVPEQADMFAELTGMKRGRQLRRPYFLSSDHVCSPHLHLNIRTVRPVWELSMVRTCAGFSPHWLHARIGLGSKLENTSFLNSLLMENRPACPLSTKVNACSAVRGRIAKQHGTIFSRSPKGTTPKI